MNTRPTPTGFEHYLEVTMDGSPPSELGDSVRALADLEDGLELPIVQIVAVSDGSFTVRVSVFTDASEPTPADIAALEGQIAEVRFSSQ